MVAYAVRRMGTPSSGGPADIELIWGCPSRTVCLSGIFPLSAALLPEQGHLWHGCNGIQLAPVSAQVRIPPSETACTDIVQGQGG